MSRIFASFASLPRAAKWGLSAACIVAVYFLVLEPVLDRTNEFASRADVLERNLTRMSRVSSPDSEDGALLESTTRAFGKPHLPTDSAAKAGAIQRVVDDVLSQHKVTDNTMTEKSGSLTGDYTTTLAGGIPGRIERYIVEFSFEATQETVVAVLADLEQSPAVSAVSRVKIDRAGVYSRDNSGEDPTTPQLVRATISAESWVFLPAKAGETSGGTD